MKAMRYTVIVEEGPPSFGAYVPDLPGCVAAGRTREEVVDLIRDAIELHLADLRERGLALPVPTHSSLTIDIAA